MRKKILLSSVLTIAICLSLIAGSTYALFTSGNEMNISVTSGKVEMFATVDNLKLYSVEANANGAEIDEKGNHYAYKEVKPFTNGGDAEFANSVLTIEKITPGDKVEFDVVGDNTSNVIVKYRYIIECVSGYELMDGLVVTLGEGQNAVEYARLKSITSNWMTLDTANDDMEKLHVAVELPVEAGNTYQQKTAKIRVAVEVVQGNAVVDDNPDPIVDYLP